MEELIQGFYLTVDGKRYGPYKNTEKQEVASLLHLKGVVVEHVMLPLREFPSRSRR